MLVTLAQTLVAAVLVFGGIAVLIIGWRGLRATLPRNRFAGVRTPATMRSDETFRLGNRVAAPATLAGGAVLMLVGFCLPLVGSTSSALLLLAIGIVGMVGLVLAGGVLGHRAAAAMPETAPGDGGCGGCAGGCCGVLQQG